MGSGASTTNIPIYVDKTECRKFFNGSTIYDEIFDLYSNEGTILRDDFIRILETKDCYVSAHPNDDLTLVNDLINNLQSRNLRVGSYRSPYSATSSLPSICQAIDQSFTIIILLSENYLKDLSTALISNQSSMEFNYISRTKPLTHIFPIIMDTNNNNSMLETYQRDSNLSNILINSVLFDSSTFDSLYSKTLPLCRMKGPLPIKLNLINDIKRVSRDEAQLYTWISRCSTIDDHHRTLYCASLIQKGIFNILQLSAQLTVDPTYLSSMGFLDKDANEIGIALQDLGTDYIHKTDFSKFETFEQVTFAIKKSLEVKNHEQCCMALKCIENYVNFNGAITTNNNTMDKNNSSISNGNDNKNEVPTVVFDVNVSRAKQVIDSGFAPVLIRMFQDHLENVDILANACRVIFILCIAEESQIILGDSIINFLIVRAMQSYANHVDLAQNSCMAIAALCSDKNNRLRLGTASACDAVCRVLKQHLSNAIVVLEACKALEKLQINVFENTCKLGIVGANVLMIESLHIHVDNMNIIQQIYKVLLWLCQDVENRNILGQNIYKNFIHSMNIDIDNAYVTDLGCQVIHALTISSSYNRDQLTLHGIGDVLKLIIKDIYSKNLVSYQYHYIHILKSVCIAIQSLLNGSPQHKPKFNGIKETLTAILNEDKNQYKQLTDHVINHIKEAILRL